VRKAAPAARKSADFLQTLLSVVRVIEFIGLSW
jgi:hypothetical protein